MTFTAEDHGDDVGVAREFADAAGARLVGEDGVASVAGVASVSSVAGVAGLFVMAGVSGVAGLFEVVDE
ncbi:hypothetical protein [Arthrobacter subterraneus]|uniref:hypothetical protein n=1 Tax=Arthrobacter subterraneus TaxID=335973 RepID=UPI0038201861